MEELRTRLDGLQQRQDEEDDPTDDEDDARSVSTVGRRPGKTGEGEDVVELFEDADDELMLEEEGSSRPERGGMDASFGRPSTPEPTSRHRPFTSDDDDEDNDHNPIKYSPSSSSARPSSSRDDETSLLGSLHQQVETLIDNSQLVLVQNETLALRLGSLEVEHSEVLSSISMVLERVMELKAKEQKWEGLKEGWTRERESMDVEREKMKGIIKEWEEAKRRNEEEQEEKRLNEGREDTLSAFVRKQGRSNSSSPPSPPLSDQGLDLPIPLGPTLNHLDINSSDRTLSPSHSPSRPKRAPVPSVFKSRPSSVRRISSSGTLRPAGFLGLVREGEATIFDGGVEEEHDMATIRGGQIVGGKGGGMLRRVEPVEVGSFRSLLSLPQNPVLTLGPSSSRAHFLTSSSSQE